MNVIELAQKLIRFNTVNPPGNEKDIAEYCAIESIKKAEENFIK